MARGGHEVAPRDRRRRRRRRCPPARCASTALLDAQRRRSPRRPPTRGDDPALLALLVGLDRQAQGHACTRTPTPGGPPSCTARRVLGLTEHDVCFSAAKLFFAYGLGNALTFPLSVGATRRADGRAADARRRLQALDRQRERRRPASRRRRLLRRADRLRRHARVARAAGARRGRAAHVLVGRRSAAGARSASASSATSAATIIDGIGSTEMLHVFLSNRPGDVRYGTTGKPVAGLRDRAARRRRPPGRRRRGRRPLHQGPERGADVLGQPREVARDLPGRLDQERRQVRARRRRLLHLLRPQRRHAEGERHLGLAVRGRGDADAAPGGARVRGHRHRGRRGPDQDQGLRRRSSRAQAVERRRAQGLRQGEARAVQVPALDRVPRRAAEDGDRQDPALPPARARARAARRRERRVRVDARAFVELDWRGRPLRARVRMGRRAARRAQPVVVFLHEGLGSVSMWRDFPRAFCDAHGLAGFVFSRYGYGRSTPQAAPTSAGALDFMHAPGERGAAGAVRRRSASSGPGSSATATAPRSRCCTPRAIRRAGVVAVAPHIFVEDVSIASIEKARDAYEPRDLRERSRRTTPIPIRRSAAGTTSGWRRRFAHWNIEREIATIACPVLAVQGEDDEYGTLEQIRGIARRLPKTRLLVIAGLRTLAASRPARDPRARGGPIHRRHIRHPLKPGALHAARHRLRPLALAAACSSPSRRSRAHAQARAGRSRSA